MDPARRKVPVHASIEYSFDKQVQFLHAAVKINTTAYLDHPTTRMKAANEELSAGTQWVYAQSQTSQLQ